MCSQLMVLVTLALAWTSSILSGTSLVVPRAGDTEHVQRVAGGKIIKPASESKATNRNPGTRNFRSLRGSSKPGPSEVDIAEKRLAYGKRPSAPYVPHGHFSDSSIFSLVSRNKVEFRLLNDRSRQVGCNVQTWHGIPNFLAFEIAKGPDSSNGDLATVPAVVTAYTKSLWNKDKKQFIPAIPENHLAFQEPTVHELTQAEVDALLEKRVEYPTLYVAPWEPGGSWSVGTALWKQILYILQDRYREGNWGTKLPFNHLILQIAAANPYFSKMLYFDHQDSALAPAGFRLLSTEEIKQSASAKATTLRNVIKYVPSPAEESWGVKNMHDYLIMLGYHRVDVGAFLGH